MRILHTLILALISSFAFGSNPYINADAGQFLKSPIFNAPINIENIDLDLIEAGVFYLGNAYRAQKNRSALSYSKHLSFAAYTHSEQMYTYNFFDHINKNNKALASLEKRAIYASYNNYVTLAENIFYGYIELNDVGTYKSLCLFILEAFITSKGHRANLLARDIKEMGCGIYFNHSLKDDYLYFYFTQDLGSTYSVL